jgi:hypothetical protein
VVAHRLPLEGIGATKGWISSCSPVAFFLSFLLLLRVVSAMTCVWGGDQLYALGSVVLLCAVSS